MAQIAAFRGALWDRTKVDLAAVTGAPLTDVRGKLERGELVRDGSRTIYRYLQTFQRDGRTVTCRSTICAVRLEPWKGGTIRAHEATDAKAKELAIKGIASESAHTMPVLYGFRDAAGEIERTLRGAEGGRPAIEVTTKDGTLHRVFAVASAELAGKLRTLLAPKKLHVLDGHARYEGMLAHSEKLAAGTMYSSANYGLGCLVNVAEPALVVAPRHRIVRGTGLTREAVLAATQGLFVVDKLAGVAKDAGKQVAALADTLAHQPAFVVTFAGDPDAWKLTLSPDVAPTALGVSVHRALQKYDPIVFLQVFLARVAPGATSETSLDPAAVVKAVTGAAAAGSIVGAILRPLTIDQILHADELGQVLPFGSTAFAPPIPGLLGYLVEPDEELI